MTADDFPQRCADRTAVERVYHAHRLGAKPLFGEAMPPAAIEQLVRKELHQEQVLQSVYGVTLTPALVDAEVARIQATTRAPEMLAEIQAALGHDPARFARTFARPLVVERLLRERFENDDSLHAPQRERAARLRRELLAAKTIGAGTDRQLALLKQCPSAEVREITWHLEPRPAQAEGAEVELVELKKRFGPDARILSSSNRGREDRKVYFEDLPAELQNVLRRQLHRAGDVSAVIEAPGGYVLYMATDKTDAVLSAACLAVPRRSYESWLAEQRTPP